jgi:hypothetical protein
MQVTADNPVSPSGNWNNHDVLVNQTGSANFIPLPALKDVNLRLQN